MSVNLILAMQINLTWDLFIIVLFIIIIAYSFIIGKSNTVKLVLASYLSILAADAIGNMIDLFILNASPIIYVFNTTGNSQFLVISKITLFILFMVSFSVKGAFEITMNEERPSMEFLSTFFFGALSAGVIISGILVFTSGMSLIGGTSGAIDNSNIADMYQQSYLVKVMVMNYNLWFALPAVSFLVISLVKQLEE